MFKFLRKYNKLMLAFFGVLLMITFLIPQAIDRLGRSAGSGWAVFATVGDGELYSGADVAQAQQELQFIQKLGGGISGLGSIDRPEHWYLLVREAEAAGLIGAVPQGDLIQRVQQLTQEYDPRFVGQTIAKIRGVEEMINLFQTGGLYSDRRLKTAAERLLHMVSAEIVVIQPDEDQSAFEPSEDQIAAQMAKYADVLPGQGESGFGYRLPDRLKLEWLSVSADSVRKIIEQSEQFSSVAQRRHWRANLDDKAKNFPPIEDGAAVPDIVKDDLLNKLTQEKLEEIAKYVSSQIGLNRRGIPEKDGYAAIPPDWAQRKLSFQQLAADIQSKFNIDLPAYESTGERWVPIADVSTLEGVGNATTDKFGNTPLSLTQLVEWAREFNPAQAMIPIQQDIVGPPLKDYQGNIYVFRIIAADPARKPVSADEVRDAVVADLKRSAAYEQLEQQAGAIEQEAETQGLLALALDHQTRVQPASSVYLCNPFMVRQAVQSNRPITALPATLPVLGSHRPTIEKVIDYALTLPRSTPIEELSEPQRVLVVPVKDKLSVLVVRLTRQTPLSREDFTDLAQNGAIHYLVSTEESQEETSLSEAFGLEALVKRHNFVYAREGDDEDEPVPPADPPA